MGNSRKKESFTFFKSKKHADSKFDISNFTFFKNEGVKAQIQENIPKERHNIRNFTFFKNEHKQKENKLNIFFPSEQQDSSRNTKIRLLNIASDLDKNQIHNSIEKSDELLYFNNNKKQDLSQNFFIKKMNNDQNKENFSNDIEIFSLDNPDIDKLNVLSNKTYKEKKTDVFIIYDSVYKLLLEKSVKIDDFRENNNHILELIIEKLYYSSITEEKKKKIIRIAEIIDRILDIKKGRTKEDILIETGSNDYSINKILSYLIEVHNFDVEARFPTISTKSLIFRPNSNIGTISEADFSTLLDSKLQNAFKKYLLKTNVYANKGNTITTKFKLWVKENYNDKEQKWIFQKSNDIYNNNEIYKFILFKTINSKLSQTDIYNLSEKMGINFNQNLIKKVVSHYLYNNDQNSEGYIERCRNKAYRKVDLSDLSFNNLWNIKIWNIFRLYKRKTGKYPNKSFRLNKAFLEWAIRNFPDYSKILNDINSNQEIIKLIILKTENTNLPSLKIFELLERISIHISHKSIIKIAQDNLNLVDRFPRFRPRPQEIFVYENLLNKDLQKAFKIYLLSTNKHPNYALDITFDFQNWILDNRNNSFTLIKKFHLINLVDKINENQEIYNLIKYFIDKTEYTSLEIREKLHKFNLDFGYSAILNIALKDIYNNDNMLYKERFPSTEPSIRGIIIHYCINVLLTYLFRTIKNANFYSQPSNLFYDDNVRIDGVLEVDNSFFEQIITSFNLYIDFKELRLNLSENILIIFDFTSDLTIENIEKKINKYGHKDVLFFIVGTNWYSSYNIKQLPEEFKYKFSECFNNIRVISPFLFAKIFHLSSTIKKFFYILIDNNTINNTEELSDIKEKIDFNFPKYQIYKKNIIPEHLRISKEKIVNKNSLDYFLDF